MAVKFLLSCTLSQVTFLIFPGNNFLQRKVLLRIKYYHCTPCDSVFTLTPKTMQTTQYRKPRIWEMRVDKYTKSLAKNQVCEIMSYARYSEQRFTQIYKALYWETTRCPFEKHKIWPPEPTDRNICC